jgi:cytochrome c biogenesis protein CcmG/thiol:disulfide interchange protein DsbE
VPVLGINYKDTRPAAKRWLDRFGDPFSVIAFDHSGRIGIDWGVAAVPETFVVDRSGTIRYKVVGPITQKEMNRHLIPELKRLQAAS